MKQVHDKEFESLIAMAAPERYAVFIKRVADWQELWGLRSHTGWTLMADDLGNELVPVWPHNRFADACADENIQEQSKAILLDDWLKAWTPGLIRDNRKVAVFPVTTGQGIVVTPQRLESDLRAACKQYE